MNKDIISLDNKKLNILLNFNERECISVDSLALTLGVTTRSVRTYVKQLNEELGSDIAELKYFKNMGYKLIVSDLNRFNMIISESQKDKYLFNYKEDRIRFIIEYLCELQTEYVTTDFLADLMNVGRTTLINDLQLAENIIESYNCSVKKRQNKGMFLDATEIDIRILINNYLFKSVNMNIYSSKYFENVDSEKFDTLKTNIIRYFKEEKYSITNYMLNELYQYIIVLLHRIQQNKHISSISKKYKLLLNRKEYELSAEILNLIELTFDVKLNQLERVYLTLPMITRNSPIQEKHIESDMINDEVSNLVDEILEYIFFKTGIKIVDDDFKANLAQHLSYTLNRLIFNIEIKNVFLNEIRDNYKLPYELARIAVEVIEKKYDVMVPKDELGYIAIHFGGFLESKSLIIKSLKRIALICETGLGTAMFLKARIKKIVSPECEIDVFSTHTLNELILNYYDIVFSTSEIQAENMSIPVVKIDTLFDEEKFTNRLENILYLRKENKKIVDTNDVFITKFMKKNIVYFLDCNDITEVLTTILESLIQNEYIENNFKSVILSRELTNPTIFDNGIMMPHAVSEIAEEILVACGILSKPIRFNGKIIKIVFMLIIPDNVKVDSDLLVKIYDELLSICYDEKMIDKISSLKTYSEIVEILNQISK